MGYLAHVWCWFNINSTFVCEQIKQGKYKCEIISLNIVLEAKSYV